MYIRVDVAHHEICCAKVGKGGIFIFKRLLLKVNGLQYLSILDTVSLLLKASAAWILLTFISARSRSYKTFFMLNSTEHEIYHAHNVRMPIIKFIILINVKMPTIIGIVNTPPKSLKARKNCVFVQF